ncbi:hypothetical protein BDW74DRAFT_154897 [Aspergillus multicolor]|uniref:uncharacterized protein n=1 Tax=Aspergillus multicolor TaxID=41759 RepID=UPI003CCE0F7F
MEPAMLVQRGNRIDNVVANRAPSFVYHEAYARPDGGVECRGAVGYDNGGQLRLVFRQYWLCVTMLIAVLVLVIVFLFGWPSILNPRWSIPIITRCSG